MHVHILGICGTFMGGIAALAKEAGHRVTGSDANVYPPMSDQLRALGIGLTEGWDPAQLAVGNCTSIGDWLAPRIWQQGARHDLDPMLLHATGEPLSDNALREQLEQRHGRIH